MKRIKIFNRPARIEDMSLDDYNDTYDSEWRQQGKIQRMQLKRWRKIKHQMI